MTNKSWMWGLLLPPVLILTTSMVFQTAAMWLEKEAAYLLGFAFYWLFWCLLVPGLALKNAGLGSLLRDRKPLLARENWHAAFLWILVTAVALGMYARDFLTAPLGLVLLALPLAAINGACEELLWRGFYVRAFPASPWLGILVPAAGFALWHFVPQILLPAENQVGFVLSTFFLGLAYGWIAFRTGSAKWTALSHSLNGAIALADPLARIVSFYLQ